MQVVTETITRPLALDFRFLASSPPPAPGSSDLRPASGAAAAVPLLPPARTRTGILFLTSLCAQLFSLHQHYLSLLDLEALLFASTLALIAVCFHK
ncbi:hypothetical protein GUJ93_ZPchr0002g25739 [Zizania palustris]|uniref:Uncharacterized protein n=1 Tax=Zizania palustris TaxID=103762 RepID=A0A8J5RRA6_ZIZPA|nr:hypothetical protein GUJ93_ZPchr0002g25739 [Zizania palustris]